MGKKLRFLFYAIEINLILWMIAWFSVQPGAINMYGTKVVFAGFLFAAILQHWAYYKIYQEFKDK